MKRGSAGRIVAAVFFALTALGLGLYAALGPTMPQSTGSVGPEPSSIEAFDVEMVLTSEGSLLLDETITVGFPILRRGIFRIFDTADPRRDLEHPVEDLEVTRDGVSEPWTWVDSAEGTATARIGDENVYLDPGSYTYRLSSKTSDVLEPKVVDGKEDSEVTWFWWDVIGGGWQMPMQNVTVHLALPVAPLEVECVMGVDTPCEPTVDGESVSLTVPALSPKEPVTFRVSLPSDQVPPNEVAGDDWPLAAGVGVLALVVGALGLVVTRERAPGFPVLYEPPAGIRPAVGVRVLDEKASSSELQATLFDLGERGVVRLERTTSDTWAVHLVAPPSRDRCDPWEAAMLHELGLAIEGNSFGVTKSISAGKAISSATSKLSTGAAAAASPYLHGSAIGGLYRFLAWISWLGVAVMAGFHLFADWDAPPLLVFGVTGFAVGASLLAVDKGRGTVRTAEGRDVWSRTGGFARFLSTDSSESRFDAAAHLDLYPRYLPWAVALGMSEEWLRRYQAQGVTPAAVPYVYGYGYGHGHGYDHDDFSDFNDSFSGAISAASATYAASQSSSSSGGGGGFSGGSGGGGGGGGSW